MSTEKSIYGVIQMNEKQDNVIPIRRDIIRICDEKINAAIMLTQIIYWTDRVPESNAGWLWKSDSEWFAETGLTEKQCDTARKILTDLGFIEIRYGVANAHKVRFYRPKTENIINALSNYFEKVKPQNEDVKPQNEDVKPQNEDVKPQKGETITESMHSFSKSTHSLPLQENLKINFPSLSLETELATARSISRDEGFATAQPSDIVGLPTSLENIDTKEIFIESIPSLEKEKFFSENNSITSSINRETPVSIAGRSLPPIVGSCLPPMIGWVFTTRRHKSYDLAETRASFLRESWR